MELAVALFVVFVAFIVLASLAFVLWSYGQPRPTGILHPPLRGKIKDPFA